MKIKEGQNSFGTYKGYSFNSTMTKLTVFNAPVWAMNEKGKWIMKKEKKDVTVGVKDAKDFDFESLFNLAINHPVKDIYTA